MIPCLCQLSVFAIILFSISSQAKTNSCKYIFKNVTEIRQLSDWKTGNSLRDALRDFDFEKHDFKFAEIETAIEKGNLPILVRHLESRGIKTKISSIRKRIYSAFKTDMIEILPVGDSELNLLAMKMWKNFGVRLVYFAQTPGSVASYQPYKKLINLSSYSIVSGLPDFSLLHEIKHAALFAKYEKGLFNFESGMILEDPDVTRFKLYGGKADPTFLSLQEVLTWRQDFMLEIASLRQFAKENTALLLNYRISEFLSQSTNFESALMIFEQTQDAAQRTIESLKLDKGVKVDGQTKNALTGIFRYGGKGFYVQTVPKSYLQTLDSRWHRGEFRYELPVLSHLQIPISQALQLTDKKQLRAVRRQIAITFLNDFVQEISSERVHLQNLWAGLKQIQLAAKLKKENKINLEFSRLVLALGKDRFPEALRAFSEPKIDPANFTTLPLTGYKVQDINPSDIQISTKYSIAEQKSLEANNYSLVEQVIRNGENRKEGFHDSQYHLSLVKDGRQSELLIEDGFMANSILDVADILQEKGFFILSIQIFSTRRDLQATSPLVSKFIDMDYSEINARNLYRIRQVIGEQLL